MSSTIVESSAMKQHHPQLPPYLRPPPPSTPSASATAPSSPAPAPPASSGQRHGSTQHSHDHHHHHHSLPPPGPPPSRVHTLDLKGKLAAALGNHGKQYWNALLHFCSAKISRDEFEQQARSCLRSEDGECMRRRRTSLWMRTRMPMLTPRVLRPSRRSPLAQLPRPRHSLQCLVCRSRPLIHPRCSHVNLSRRWCRCGWRRPCAIRLVQVPLDRHHGASQATASPRRLAHCKGAAEDQVCGQATCSLLCIGC